MKTAKEWHDEIGYASTDPKLTQHRIDKIREIQIEALEIAAMLVCFNAKSPKRAVNEICGITLKIRKQKTVAPAS